MRKFIDQIATNVLRYLPAITGFTVPLFFLNLTPDYFAFNKQFLIFVLATIALVAYFLRTLARGRIHLSLSPSLLFAFLITIAYLIPSIWFHANPRLALFGPAALIISLTIIFITVSSSQKNHQTVTSTIYGLIISSVILSLTAILHKLGLLSNLTADTIVTNPLFSLSGNTFNSVTFLTPLFLGTLAYAITNKNWIQKSLLFASSLIMLIGIVISAQSLLPQGDQKAINILPLSAGWSIAVDNLKNVRTAVFGSGPDKYPDTFTRFRPATLNLDKNLWTIKFTTSSTEVLNIVTTTGIFGLVAFLLFIISPLIITLKKAFKQLDPETFFIVTTVIATLLFFFALPASILSYTTLFLSVALLNIQLKILSKNFVKDVHIGITADEIDTNPYRDITSTVQKIQLPVLPWLLAASGAILIYVFWNGAYRIYLGATYINQAAKESQYNSQKSFEYQLMAANADMYNPYYRINLSKTYLAAANGLLSQKNLTEEQKQTALNFADQSTKQANVAINLDPGNVAVWENYAAIARQLSLLNVQGAIDWTLASYGQAITTDPTNPILRVQLGSFYYLLGDFDNAVLILNQALNLKPDWNITYLNLSQVYRAKKEFAKALAYSQEGLKYTENVDDIATINADISSLQELVIPAQQTQTATESATPAFQ